MLTASWSSAGELSSARRIIARLDVKGPNVVRGMQLEGLRVVGEPHEMAERYDAEGIDELIFVDTVATLYGRNSLLDVVRQAAGASFIPMTVGGGIRDLDDVVAALRSGADKVSVNSQAVREPELIRRIADQLGSQCVVVTIEAKKQANGTWTVMIENGREPTGVDAVEWAERATSLGAGEILLTAIDRDGMRNGFDLGLTRRIADAVPVPVIASGGAGTAEHVSEAFLDGHADAVALGTLLHFRLDSIASIKAHVRAKGTPVRPLPEGRSGVGSER